MNTKFTLLLITSLIFVESTHTFSWRDVVYERPSLDELAKNKGQAFIQKATTKNIHVENDDFVSLCNEISFLLVKLRYQKDGSAINGFWEKEFYNALKDAFSGLTYDNQILSGRICSNEIANPLVFRLKSCGLPCQVSWQTVGSLFDEISDKELFLSCLKNLIETLKEHDEKPGLTGSCVKNDYFIINFVDTLPFSCFGILKYSYEY